MVVTPPATTFEIRFRLSSVVLLFYPATTLQNLSAIDNQSADFRLIEHLRSLGHDVTAISRDYPHSLPDTDVLTIAVTEERILVVADRDFGELIYHQQWKHAGVIFYRLPGASLTVKIERINAVLADFAGALAEREFLVVTTEHIRIARQPQSGK